MTSVPCRKSKRVAKRQEDEIFWLLHNFPQGLKNNDSVETKSSPKKSKEFISSVNEKLKDESSSKIAIKIPKMLRSGKTIKPPSVSGSESDKSSYIQEKDDIGLPSNIQEKDTENSQDSVESSPKTYNTRARSLNNLLDFDDKKESLPHKRNSSPVFKHKQMAKKQKTLTLEEQEQLERIERSKLPKFQVQPNKIITRSGAQYPFTWKNSNNKSEKNLSLSSEYSSKSDNTPISPSVATRSSDKKLYTSNLNSKNNKNNILNVLSKISASNKGTLRASVKVKQEPNEFPEELVEIKRDIKKLPEFKLNIDCKVGIRCPKYILANGNCNKLPNKNVSGLRNSKRKRLSLLPTQKPDKDEDFTATWFDALNRNHSSSPLATSVSSCSTSPTSSVGSESIVPQKRTGRTASLNCRAVLSALMKPEPLIKKQSRKSPPKHQSSPKSKAVIKVIKSDNHPDDFFKVKVNSSFCQKVEYHHSGNAIKIYHAPSQLQTHESAILSQYKKVKVSTNGWEWLGSYIDCWSFYTEDNKKSTRLYFSAMKQDDVELRVGDSVALQTNSVSDTKPFVGKIVSMWQDNLGEMMVTMCWFYRPSDLDNIKTPFGVQELYLSKHTDDNSVATIQNKVHVLSYPEYCRYYSYLAHTRCAPYQKLNIVPNVVKWRKDATTNNIIQQDLVYFCRGVYDFRLRRTLKQQLYYTKYL